MVHFKNLRLRPHKGLQGADLMELRQINVICGPNNSGKTTVLECIASESLRSIGIEADPETPQRLARQSVLSAGWKDQSALDQKYFGAVGDAWKTRSYWFAGESEELWKPIGSNWRRNFGTWADPAQALKAHFERLFEPSTKSALVPPKRRLEITRKTNASETIQTDGAGLLNFLFTAKNQEESSRARKDYDRICDSFRNITQGFEFGVFLQHDTQIRLRFRRAGGEWVNAESCGLGLQDILVMLYFAISGDHDVVLIEEPENHLHPEIQRRLFSFIREETKRQFFLSTHSSVFLNTQLADHVFLCRFDKSVTVQNATSRAIVLSELGYSIADNLVSDVIVLCEGPTDKVVLEEFFTKLGLDRRINIKIWPLGGDIMTQLDLSVFSESYRVVALVDKDPGSSTIRRRFLEKCRDFKIECHRLERYALENYFSVRAMKAVIPRFPNDIDKIDFDKPVAEQIGFQVKGNATRIAKEMQLDEIEGTDLFEFLEKIGGS